MTPETQEIVVKVNRSSRSLVTIGLILFALAVPVGWGGGRWLQGRVEMFKGTFRQEQEARMRIEPTTDMEGVLVQWLDEKNERYLHLLQETWPWILILPTGMLCGLGATLVIAGFALRIRFRRELEALAKQG